MNPVSRSTKPIFNHILQRSVTGLLLFIPFFALGFVLVETFLFARATFTPILEWLEIDTAWSLLLLNISIISGLCVLIFLFGFIAELPPIARRMQAVDRGLTALVPGYVIVKGIIGGVINEDSLLAGLRPVIVPFDHGHRLGFEVERSEAGQVVVFLPNAPTINSGISIAFAASDVRRVDIPPHRVLEIQSLYGRGLAEDFDQATRRDSVTNNSTTT